jgi:site-specific DNA recombinase
MPTRAAIYLRISSDPDGTSTATQRQLLDCKRYAKLKGWKVAEVFEDIDVSAYNKAIRRPRYEEMLAGLRTGRFDGVLVWKLDRLVRRVSEFEKFWEICGAADATLASFNESIDTGSEIGMLIVRILVAFAEMESANTRLRVKASEAERARAGKPKLIGMRPYGITADWSALVPDEAERIREAADRVLAGESLRSISLDWNARGIPTSTGKRWESISLRTLLRQERLWGLRTYAGETVELVGVPRILDEPTGTALAAALDVRAGIGANGNNNNRRSHLLSGLLTCGKCGADAKACGAKMVAGKYLYRAGKRYPRYVCEAPPRGCAGTSLQMEAADRIVSDMALYRLESPRMVTMLKAHDVSASKDAKLMAELAGAEGRQRDLEAQWARGQLSIDRLDSRQRQLDQVIDGLRRELALTRRAQPVRKLLEERASIRDAWEELPTGRKRAILETLLERVVVHRPTRLGNVMDIKRFEPIWRV